jgi:hypothetical protein
MSRVKSVRFAAITTLALFGLAANAQAQNTYNAASDWLSTYANTTAVGASHSASWGAGSAWSAGELSWNWTNQIATVGNSSLQDVATYYTPNTVGYLTSGATIKATYTYTVPFHAYQFNPGSSYQVAVGQTFTEQVASGYKPEKNGGSDSTSITLPTGITSAGAATGLLNEVGGVVKPPSGTIAGFGTTSYSPQSGKFNDGDGSVQAATSSVFYNYGANVTSTSLSSLNFPSGATSDALQMSILFGPTYVAWTAPQGGNVTVNMTATDLGGTNPSDGDPGFFVLASTAGVETPIMSASQFVATGGVGAQYTLGSVQSQYSSTIAGSTFGTSTPSWASAYSSEGALSLQWVSGSFYVTTGETLYFVGDNGHDQIQSHGNHSTGTSTDPFALSAAVTFTAVPEPSSVVLMGMAGVGLALAAWKRRRSA